MPTRLDVVARYRHEEGCILNAQLEQKMFRTRPIRQRLAKIAIMDSTRHVTFLPYEHSDTVLLTDLSELTQGKLNADWFSTICGYAGSVSLRKSRSAEILLAELENPVYALTGFYDLEDTCNPSRSTLFPGLEGGARSCPMESS